MKRYLLVILIALFCSDGLIAQRKGKALSNLGAFDTRPYHFGVQLSVNTADFQIQRKLDPLFSDSILSFSHSSQPGFNIAIITSLNLNKNLSLRFIPGISPKERKISYLLLRPDGRNIPYDKIVSSFYIDFPLLIKYRTDRINNFAAYVIAGAQYSRDMSSQEKVKNELASLEDQVVKIRRGDMLVNVGGGFDFFLPYFKFGLELKMGYGMRDLLIDDGTIFSNPLQELRSQNWVISMTFEG